MEGSDFNYLIRDNDYYIEELTSRGDYSIYIFEKDSLVLWSDNSIPILSDYASNGFKDGAFFTSNTWGLCREVRENDYTVVGIAPLQRAYPYENKYLSNDFLLGSGIASDYTVTGITGPNVLTVYDDAGNELYNLIPTKSEGSMSVKEISVIILNVLLILAVLLFIQDLFVYGSKRWKSNWWLIALAADLIFFRWLMIKFSLPGHLYDTSFFTPFSNGTLFFASHGDLIITGIFIFLLAFNFSNFFILYPSKISKEGESVNPKLIDSFTIVGWTSVILAFFGMSWLFEKILSERESLFEIHKVLTISVYNISDMAFFVIILAAFVFFVRTIINQLIPHYTLLRLLLVLTVSLVIVILFSRLFSYIPQALGLVLFLLLVAVFSLAAYKGQEKLDHAYSVMVILLGSVFLIQLFYSTNQQKESLVKSQVLDNLANEHDQIAEMLFPRIDAEILDDNELAQLVLNTSISESFIGSYVRSNYFGFYWNRYVFSANLCDSINPVSIILEDREEPCLNFFDGPIELAGRRIAGTSFYYLDNFDGYINYTAKYPFYTQDSSNVIHLFISLDSILLPQELGYPDLLISGAINRRDSMIQGFSYAKYQDGKLVSKAGEYVYSMTSGNYPQEIGRIFSYTEDNYEHQIYKLNSNHTIILSSPKFRLWDHILSFSYVFVLLYILWLVVSSIYYFPDQVRGPDSGLKRKIEFIMISVFLVSFVLIGTGMTYYIIGQYDKTNRKNIVEKTQSVLIELKHKLNEEPILNAEWSSESYPSFGDLLVKFSFVFNSDINLFDPDGEIMATSRPEVFDRQLINRKMDPYAYHELSVHDKMEFVHFEKIGKMGYWSAYAPFYNINNELIAYLNLPYFAKQSVIRQEISTFIVAILNAYFLLIFVAVLLGVFLGNQVTKPLRLLQEKFTKMELGGLNQKVDYKKKDEIGSLVKSYNRMVDELEISAGKLAKSERETAWREMARQIAHEIKNPLTPMKLSVQHLQRAWNDKAEDWEVYFKRVSQTLVEQINSLSAIADEFAQFARMPQSHFKVVDIVHRVKKSVALFEISEAGKIEVSCSIVTPIPVYVDEEQLQQVFNNILKNAFQATPKSRKPKVMINIRVDGSEVFISFTDNGSGVNADISEKLFQPNFTTKTSGMGLGLAISKGIIESSGGKIWYEKSEGEGSTFYISLPISKN